MKKLIIVLSVFLLMACSESGQIKPDAIIEYGTLSIENQIFSGNFVLYEKKHMEVVVPEMWFDIGETKKFTLEAKEYRVELIRTGVGNYSSYVIVEKDTITEKVLTW